MVFATEFDPLEQSQRRQTDRIKTDPVQPSLNRLDLSSAANFRSNRANPRTHPSVSHDASYSASHSVSNSAHHDGNVVPLRLGAPAVRVRHERSDDLAIALPSKLKLPLGLKLLNRIQQGSTIVTGFLITGALLVYGSTVYVDKSTSRSVAQLDALQGESQQLTSANEALKQSLAEQATRPDSGLKPYQAGDTLFVAPAPRRDSAQSVEPAAEMPVPLGY
jgi:hypothetical protein